MPEGVKGFQKGHAKFGGNQLGSSHRWTAEVKDTIQRVFEGLDGYEGLLAWCKADAQNQSDFYTKIWVKLLPMRLNVKAHKDVVYHSVQEVNEALGQRGLSLETIERIKQIDLTPDDVINVTPNGPRERER